MLKNKGTGTTAQNMTMHFISDFLVKEKIRRMTNH